MEVRCQPCGRIDTETNDDIIPPSGTPLLAQIKHVNYNCDFPMIPMSWLKTLATQSLCWRRIKPGDKNPAYQ